jgi:hypothetical protein
MQCLILRILHIFPKMSWIAEMQDNSLEKDDA